MVLTLNINSSPAFLSWASHHIKDIISLHSLIDNNNENNNKNWVGIITQLKFLEKIAFKLNK